MVLKNEVDQSFIAKEISVLKCNVTATKHHKTTQSHQIQNNLSIMDYKPIALNFGRQSTKSELNGILMRLWIT